MKLAKKYAESIKSYDRSKQYDLNDAVKTVIDTAKAKFDEAGIEDVSITLYEKARHEILNDFCKGQVEKDILSFIENHSGDKNA